MLNPDTLNPAPPNSHRPLELDGLTERVLNGETLSVQEGLHLLNLPDTDTLRLVDAAWRVRREAFEDALIGGLAQVLGSPRLAEFPTLLPLVSGLLRGVVYETVVRERPTADAQALAASLNAFIRGGVQAVAEEAP